MPQDTTPPQEKRFRPTLEQREAQLAAQLAKIRNQRQEQSRKLANREKIIIGGAMIAECKRNPAFRQMVRDLLATNVTKAVDREVVKEWLLVT